jgi:hypothetical protein
MTISLPSFGVPDIYWMNRVSSASKVTGYRLDDRDSITGRGKDYSFSHHFRPAQGVIKLLSNYQGISLISGAGIAQRYSAGLWVE